MEFKPEGQWRYDRSVFKRSKAKGARERSRGGQITYKGKVVVREVDAEGKQTEVLRHRFLVRVGKIASATVAGTTTDALTMLYDMLAKHGTGTLVRGSRERLDSFVRSTYLPGWVTAGIAQKTLQIYRDDIENHILPALGSRTLDSITTEVLQEFVDDLRSQKRLDPKTIKNIFGVISGALTQAARLKRISGNPAKLVELPKHSNRERHLKKEKNKEKAWSREEIERFFIVAPAEAEMTRWGVIGTSTGMRPGEQCARTWSDWMGGRLLIDSAVTETDREAREQDPNLERWVLATTKTDVTRRIRLADEADEALHAQKAHVDRLFREGKLTAEQAQYIFPSYDGAQPFSNPAKIYNRWRFLITGQKSGRSYKNTEALAGVRFITPYGLRHTHATDLLRHGQNVKFVAERLGTSVEMIEKHYGHIQKDMEDEAIGNLPPMGYGTYSGLISIRSARRKRAS